MAVASFDTALNIISDAAVELGLGAVTAAYASTDPNIVQLRTALKMAGRKMIVVGPEWKNLIKETTVVTWPVWAKNTVYTAAATAWATSTAYALNDLRANSGNLYQCTTAGTSSAVGAGPNTQAASIVDGTGTLIW